MFHPTQPSWALLSVWTDECRLTAPGSPCSHKLLVTEAPKLPQVTNRHFFGKSRAWTRPGWSRNATRAQLPS